MATKKKPKTKHVVNNEHPDNMAQMSKEDRLKVHKKEKAENAKKEKEEGK